MGYSAFQKASIDKIYDYFQRHDRVICADEAGLGKTYIARGVIEKIADEKLYNILSNAKVITDCENWFMNFVNTNYAFNTFNNGIDNVKNRIKLFAKNVTGDSKWDLKEKETLKQTLLRIVDVNNPEYQKSNKVDIWFKVIKNLPNLVVAYHGTKSGMVRKVEWDIKLGNNFPDELAKGTCRILYICSNLAIAEQNTSRLAEIRQRSVRRSGKPDRLSTVWYYAQNYYTPYLELYPISYTLAKEDSEGTKEERDILEVGCDLQKGTLSGVNLRNGNGKEYRQKGEEKSLNIFYDLIIFDEFQNFGDAIAFINQTEDKVEILEKMNEKDAKDVYMKKKLYDICKHLYPKQNPENKNPKTLFLSATPFKDINTDKSKFNHISLKDIIILLGGDYSVYESCSSSKDKADYLYNIGIFRNERKNMIESYEPFVGYVECSSSGILTQTALLQGAGQGNKSSDLCWYVPEAVTQKDNYQGISLRNVNKSSFSYQFDRMDKLKGLVFSPKAIDSNNENNKCVVLDDKDYLNLSKLLWIPPTKPSHKLEGIFEKYQSFSKSFIFTKDIIAIPDKIIDLLNAEINYCELVLDCDEKKLLDTLNEKYFKKYFENAAVEVTKSFVSMLKKCGGKAIEESSLESIITYCENGCLDDVLCEFVYLYGKNSKNDIKKIFEFYGDDTPSFAIKLDDTSISVCDKKPTLRRNFNSPFAPFVIATTSIGTEGIDFHLYCDRLIHYCLPNNFVEWEQKNGRIDRRDSLAVRRWWAKPNNMWQLLEREEIEKESGGLSPHWNSGQGGLHYYYLYVKDSEEEDELMNFRELVRNNRMVLGSDGITLHMNPDEDINLSPYLREK